MDDAYIQMVDSAKTQITQIKQTIFKVINKYLGEIDTLTRENNTLIDSTLENLLKLTQQLTGINGKIDKFKETFDSQVGQIANSRLSDSLNQATTINLKIDNITKGDVDDYINIKLDNSPSIVLKEQINAVEISSDIDTIIKRITDQINSIKNHIDANSETSKQSIETEIENIDSLDIQQCIDSVNTSTEYISESIELLKKYVDIKYEGFTPKCTDKNTGANKIDELNLSDLEFNSSEIVSKLNDNIVGNKDIVRHMTGGMDSALTEYTKKILEFESKITEFKLANSEFKKKSIEYNILYIQVYNHLIFIVNYIKINITKDNNLSSTISQSQIKFFLDIVNKIKHNMTLRKTHKLGKYFYINIEILFNFFTFLLEKCPMQDINILDISDYNFKKSVFIYNSMTDILLNYNTSFAVPISVYLRINDYNITRQIFKKSSMSSVSLSKKNMKCFEEHPKNKKVTDIKYTEIFDTDDDNFQIANKMSIPSLLKQKVSIMLITYGYSGVGKSYTVFGTSQKQGLLQLIFNNFQYNNIKYRAYEIYGLSVPYYVYWQGDNIYDCIYTSTSTGIIEYKSDSEKKTFLEDGSNYINISLAEISTFDTIVTSIDNLRKTNGRIKSTINNPQSSRSIMIYDFNINIDDENVYFVIVDLPGKEDIKSTFIDLDNNLKVKSEILRKFKSEYYVKGDDDYYYTKIIKEMAYYSPYSLALSNTFAKIITDIVKADTVFKDNIVYTYFGGDFDKQNATFNVMTRQFEKYDDKKNNLFALEYMRNIIEKKNFKLIEKIYNEIFEIVQVSVQDESDENVHEQIHFSYVLAPFEGYYINENISGILLSLLKKHNINSDFIELQSDVYLPYSHFIPQQNFTAFKRKNIIAQTYFYRRYLYANIACGDRYNYQKNDININITFDETIFPKNLYDYNKVYTRDNPPINKFLKTYFSKIKHYYLFFVVSNNINCENQANFLINSSRFIDGISNYDHDFTDDR